MGQYGTGDCFWWSNHRTFCAKPTSEVLAKLFEELDVLRLFAGELQKSSRTIVVALELRSSLVQDKRKDELFDETEDTQVRVSTDLVQNLLFIVTQERYLLHASQRFRHERSGEVESLFSADNVLDAPVNSVRRSKG